MLMSTSKADAQRAALTLEKFLSNKVDANVRAGVVESINKLKEQEFDKDTATAKRIVIGIRESIAFHTTAGTWPTASKPFMKDVLTACLFKIVKEKETVGIHTTSNIIGDERDEVSCVRKQVKDLLDTYAPVEVVMVIFCANTQWSALQCRHQTWYPGDLNKTEGAKDIVEAMVWRDSARQGVKKGKEDTQ